MLPPDLLATAPARLANDVLAYIAIALTLGYGLLNGFHDASNSIAVPVVTGAMRPAPAVGVAALFNLIGALVTTTTVAATVGGIISVTAVQTIPVVGAAMLGAIVWNLATWRLGFPVSASHGLVGALAGAALADAGPGAVHWGGMDGLKPVGVIGVLVWLVMSALVVVPVAAICIKAAGRLLRKAKRRVEGPIRRGEVVTSSVLALAHGSNDSQKTMGVLTVVLVATGHISHFAVPTWVRLCAAAVLGVGTGFGGWRVARTLGRGIYRIRALDGLVSQATSSSIVLAASAAGAPVSTTDIVAPSVVGVGVGSRWRHLRWTVVRNIWLSWLVTLPASGALAAVALPAWRWLT